MRESLLAGMPSDDVSSPPPDDEVDNELRDKLRVVAKEALDLRKAGVLRVTVGDVGFELMPWIDPNPASKEEPERPDYGDLHSPSLYPGGRVPSLPRPPPRMTEEFDGEDA